MGWFCVLRIGVSDLHHSHGPVGPVAGDAVGFVNPGVAAENVGAAVLAAENGPLGEHRQTVKGHRMDGPGEGFAGDLIVEGHVDAVVVPVEGHRFYVDVGIQ